ncbi:MAG: hypothetical protein ABI743_09000 [bacterium]
MTATPGVIRRLIGMLPSPFRVVASVLYCIGIAMLIASLFCFHGTATPMVMPLFKGSFMLLGIAYVINRTLDSLPFSPYI